MEFPHFRHVEESKYPDLDPQVVEDARKYFDMIKGGEVHSMHIDRVEVEAMIHKLDAGELEPSIVYSHALNLRDLNGENNL